MKKIFIALSALFLLTACNQTTTTTNETSSVDLEIGAATKTEDGISLTIKNTGTNESGDFYFKAKLFKGEQLVGEFDKKVNSIGSNGEDTVETSFSGTEYEKGELWVDSKEEVAESNEDNNSKEF